MGLAEFILGIITNLVSEVISTKYKNLDFFKQRKIKNQVETVIAEVVEPILPFRLFMGSQQKLYNRIHYMRMT